mmetsp:Transcript_37592/g.87288  ORF Transcript_37592/g.87288 Transcript_37592/m.87288 type:complete len:230 (+) Transcript_37592:317-1006(+)
MLTGGSARGLMQETTTASGPNPLIHDPASELPANFELRNESDSYGYEGDEFDLDDDFALPPPALDIYDYAFNGMPMSIFGSSNDVRGGVDARQLSTLAVEEHLRNMNVPPDSSVCTRCPSPELATLATEATEEEEFDFHELVLEGGAAAPLATDQDSHGVPAHEGCPQGQQTEAGAALLPCGAAVRVGQRRVAARRLRQLAITTRRTAAPSCGLPVGSRRRPQHRGAAH